MFRRRYTEISRKRWYDVIYLSLIALVPRFGRMLLAHQKELVEGFYWATGTFVLMLSLYFLINELTHRHRQAFVSAAVLGSMQGIIYLDGIDLSQLWSYALLTGCIYYGIRAFRRYGSQWKDMLAWASLLAASILLGGIWPLYNYAMPLAIVSLIALRPIMRYKKWSLPVMSLVTLLLISIPFLLHPEQFVPALQHEIDGWLSQDGVGRLLDPLKWLFFFFILSETGLWLIIGMVAVCYSLRSQRIHGDPAGQISAWWLILMCVLLMLRPAFDRDWQMALLVPISCCIGSYFNLLSLPNRINRKDRRILRSSLAGTASMFLIISGMALLGWLYSIAYAIPFISISIICAIGILLLIWKKYHKKKLSIHFTEISLIIFSILLAVSRCISL